MEELKKGDLVVIDSDGFEFNGCLCVINRIDIVFDIVEVYPLVCGNITFGNDYSAGIFKTRRIIERKHIKKLNYEGEETMKREEKKNYVAVAVINQGGKDYHFAVYNDGNDYQPGDKVLVSDNPTVQTIKEVISVIEAATRYDRPIISEVITKVDDSAYQKRVKDRETRRALEKVISQLIDDVDKKEKYESYAQKDPLIKELLDQYTELSA